MYAMIVNPVSGTKTAKAVSLRIETILKDEGIDYIVLFTDENTGAHNAAKQAAELCPDGIIALGGDGTVSEIVNVIHETGIPLIIIPCGTGNDFVRMLGLPKDPVAALRIQLETPKRGFDIGRVNKRYFLNVAGTGFDVDVLKCAEKYKQKYEGFKRYFFGLIDAIRYYKPAETEISFDQQPFSSHKNAIVSIGNGRYIGGGMKAVPYAKPDDGLFDVVLVKPVPRFLILPLVFLFITGLHIRIGLAELRRCKTIRVKCPGMTVNIDGELEKMDDSEFELIHSGLFLKVPEKG